MALLNKNALFGRVITRKVELSNGDTVHILPLSAAEVIGGGDVKMEKLILRSLCDAEGTPFFTGDDDGATALSLPLADFSILGKAVLEFNGMQAADDGAGGMGGMGQAEKN